MKKIEVSAAILVQNGFVFAAERASGEWQGWWEFPGGKIEIGESAEDALKREIFEELGAKICVERKITHVEHDYGTFFLSMHVFLCSILDGELTLKEHAQSRWLSAQTLRSVRFLPADEKILSTIEQILQK